MSIWATHALGGSFLFYSNLTQFPGVDFAHILGTTMSFVDQMTFFCYRRPRIYMKEGLRKKKAEFEGKRITGIWVFTGSLQLSALSEILNQVVK